MTRILYVLAIVAALILMFWIGSQCSGDEEKYQREIATFKAERQDWLLERKVLKAERDSALRLEAARREEDRATLVEIDALNAKLERANRANAALVARLADKVEVTKDTAELRQLARDAIAAAQTAQINADSARAALSRTRRVVDRQVEDLAKLRGHIVTLEAESDSAAALLNRVPIHKGERLLGFIPLPSRTASLAIGAVAGAAAAVWLTKE